MPDKKGKQFIMKSLLLLINVIFAWKKEQFDVDVDECIELKAGYENVLCWLAALVSNIRIELSEGIPTFV